MNKEKLKQFMESEGYEEISVKEFYNRDNNLDFMITLDFQEKDYNYCESLYFKPKEKKKFDYCSIKTDEDGDGLIIMPTDEERNEEGKDWIIEIFADELPRLKELIKIAEEKKEALGEK